MFNEAENGNAILKGGSSFYSQLTDWNKWKLKASLEFTDSLIRCRNSSSTRIGERNHWIQEIICKGAGNKERRIKFQTV